MQEAGGLCFQGQAYERRYVGLCALKGLGCTKSGAAGHKISSGQQLQQAVLLDILQTGMELLSGPVHPA